MKAPDIKIRDIFGKLTSGIHSITPKFITEFSIEKAVFKALVGLWLLVVIAVIFLRIILGTKDDIEKRITQAAIGRGTSSKRQADIEKYKSVLDIIKHEEAIDKYSVKRDPFAEFKEERAISRLISAEQEFVLMSVEKVQLPLTYKGYIELAEGIIGQMNWGNTTRFVRAGSNVDGYRILAISKEKIEAQDHKGQRFEFKLNRPVFSKEPQAVLYDNLSKQNFSVHTGDEIGKYRVAEISGDYVILLSDEKEIKIELESVE